MLQMRPSAMCMSLLLDGGTPSSVCSICFLFGAAVLNIDEGFARLAFLGRKLL